MLTVTSPGARPRAPAARGTGRGRPPVPRNSRDEISPAIWASSARHRLTISTSSPSAMTVACADSRDHLAVHGDRDARRLVAEQVGHGGRRPRPRRVPVERDPHRPPGSRRRGSSAGRRRPSPRRRPQPRGERRQQHAVPEVPGGEEDDACPRSGRRAAGCRGCRDGRGRAPRQLGPVEAGHQLRRGGPAAAYATGGDHRRPACSSDVAPTTTSPVGRGTTYTGSPRTQPRTVRGAAPSLAGRRISPRTPRTRWSYGAGRRAPVAITVASADASTEATTGTRANNAATTARGSTARSCASTAPPATRPDCRFEAGPRAARAPRLASPASASSATWRSTSWRSPASRATSRVPVAGSGTASRSAYAGHRPSGRSPSPSSAVSPRQASPDGESMPAAAWRARTRARVDDRHVVAAADQLGRAGQPDDAGAEDVIFIPHSHRSRAIRRSRELLRGCHGIGMSPDRADDGDAVGPGRGPRPRSAGRCRRCATMGSTSGRSSVMASTPRGRGQAGLAGGGEDGPEAGVVGAGRARRGLDWRALRQVAPMTRSGCEPAGVGDRQIVAPSARRPRPAAARRRRRSSTTTVAPAGGRPRARAGPARPARAWWSPFADLEAVDAGLGKGREQVEVVGRGDQADTASARGTGSRLASFAGITRIRCNGRSGFSSLSARCRELPWGRGRR